MVAAAAAILASALIVGRTGYEVTWAMFTSAKNVGGNTFTARSDWAPPTTLTSVILNSLGNPGVLRQGDTYQVCASAADSGNPPSGIASLNANLALPEGNISSGKTAVPLSGGSFTCAESSYNYRSNTLTANGTLSEGTKTYAITGIDNVSNDAITTWTVTVDNTPPSATGFGTINRSNGVEGKIEIGDSMVFTYTEALDLRSIASGWNGDPTTINVTINNNVRGYSNDDIVTFSVNLGTVALGSSQYTTAPNTVLGATMLWDSSENIITVTLTSLVLDRSSVATRPSAATYFPSSPISDLAGNTVRTSVMPNETGIHF